MFLDFLWWFLMWGFVFKAGDMYFILSRLNNSFKFSFKSEAKKIMWVLIGVLTTTAGFILSIRGQTMTAYILLMLSAFLGLLVLIDLIKNVYFLLFIFLIPFSGLIGYETGLMANSLESPFLLEYLFLTLFILIPYFVYRLSINEKFLFLEIKTYLEKIQEVKIKNKKLIKDLLGFEFILDLYEKIFKIEKELEELEFKVRTNKNVISKKYFINKGKRVYFNDYDKIKTDLKYKERKGFVFSEFLSILSGGKFIQATPLESLTKAVSHFDKLLHEENPRVDNVSKGLEESKSKVELLEKLRNLSYLIFILNFFMKEDYKNSLKDYEYYTKEYIKTMKKRNNFNKKRNGSNTLIENWLQKESKDLDLFVNQFN
ncbi:MAG: hypothetical protein KC589_00075 [Nanoarchaeota archaeon]|nr:hypothetical protein [Nanoarchaeota archaeon]